MEKIIEYIRNPNKILISLASRNIIKISDKKYLEKLYKQCLHKKLNLDNPQTFNEKLQWLKLNDRNPMYTNLVDKYTVREYIRKKIGDEFLIPLLGVYDRFEDINFEQLPEQFVMKCTHDSGSTILCKNKEEFDCKSAKLKVKKMLKRNYYYYSREWPYKNIKPRIIIEKYMQNLSDENLKDYKLMCFNGKVKCSFVVSDRDFHGNLNVDFFDREWNKMPFTRHYPNSNYKIEKPNNYEKMIQLAEKLSEEMRFVRIDFYEINNKIYFGEITFYPGSGFEEFEPERYDEILGSWIKL